jgi:hypothetical protein
MAGIAEEVALLAEAALIIAPELAEIPVLGRLLVIAARRSGGEIEAMEKLQAQAKELERQTRDRIQRNAKRVIKASDAMRCVQDNLSAGRGAINFAKNVVKVIRGLPAEPLVENEIFACIEAKLLGQKSKRTRVTRTAYHRPSRGHGHGRFGRS